MRAAALVFVLGVGSLWALVSCSSGKSDVAPSDGGASDAPSPNRNDGAPHDAGSDDPACAVLGPHDFCADFNGPQLGAGWDSTRAGSLVLDGLAHSPPTSLWVATKMGTDRFDLRLEKVFRKSGTQVTSTRWIQRDAVADDTFVVTPFFLTMAQGSTVVTAILSLRNKGGSLALRTAVGMMALQSRDVAFVYPSTLADSFHQVSLTLTYGSSPNATLTIDGKAALSTDAATLSELTFSPSIDSLSLELGMVEPTSRDTPTA